ncbi:chryseobasin-related MNIO class RiPP peptide [Parafilimonas sp.]|uniref:chryseobasin-related MNIO class RiPP peptide n=1 Tax=Parafilimonas sp. TaxID=1969739 RepID=UPI003F7E6CE4
MKVSKTLLQAILVAVTASTVASCSKSVDSKPQKEKAAKTDSTYVIPGNCPACGMG